MRNTKNKGILRFLIYPEKNHFVAVCLDLDIVEEGDDPEFLKKSIREAAFGLVESVNKENFSDDLLNQPAPKEYWKKWEQAIKILKQQKIRESFKPFYTWWAENIPINDYVKI